MHKRKWLATVSALALLASGSVGAEGSGFFRKGENRKQFEHAIALSRVDPFAPDQRSLYIYLSDVAVDAAQAAAGFDLNHAVDEQIEARQGSMVAITIEGEGSPALWFSSNQPSDTFNTSGNGEFATTRNDGQRIEGRWHTAKPEDFFDETFEYDLQFKVDVVNADFKGQPLPAGGGEAGAAWSAELQAVAGKDVAYFRKRLGDSADFLLPADNPGEVDSFFEMKRFGTPKQARVKAGLQLADAVLLDVEGEDYDGNKVAGVVRMVRGERGWEAASTDLSVQW